MAIAVDTSVAVPFVLESHTAHEVVRRHLGARPVVLTGHSLAETYAVLTRLPGDARVAPVDAARLLAADFGRPVILSAKSASTLATTLAPLGVAGGAVYDALVALTALQGGLVLATRDKRAAGTYAAIGVTVDLIPS